MATKDKAQKKAKLRHAEYYDFQEIQDELYADSLKGRKLKHLMDVILLPENIRLAYRNIKANHGSKTAGTDGRTIRDLEKLSDEKLVALVQRKLDWYEPQSVRRVEIPKGSDPAKKRSLGKHWGKISIPLSCTTSCATPSPTVRRSITTTASHCTAPNLANVP